MKVAVAEEGTPAARGMQGQVQARIQALARASDTAGLQLAIAEALPHLEPATRHRWQGFLAQLLVLRGDRPGLRHLAPQLEDGSPETWLARLLLAPPESAHAEALTETLRHDILGGLPACEASVPTLVMLGLAALQRGWTNVARQALDALLAPARPRAFEPMHAAAIEELATALLGQLRDAAQGDAIAQVLARLRRAPQPLRSLAARYECLLAHRPAAASAALARHDKVLAFLRLRGEG